LESSLPALLIQIVNLRNQLVWELLVQKMVVKVKLLHDEQRKGEHFMVVPSTLIVSLLHGINLRRKLALNVNIPLWLKSGKRMKTLQSFVQSVDLKRPMLRREN